jgi:Zn-dependent peptidase ImmA (M78 family)/transcriptional regulator with XRE-family HTH domain
MDNRLYQQIGERMRSARERLGLSQEELARRLGYSSPATISHFETGQRKISVLDLRQLADILGVSLDYLYGESKGASQMHYFRAKAADISPTERENVASFLSFVHTHAGKPRTLPKDIGNMRPSRAATMILDKVNITEPPVSPHEIANYFEVAVFDWDFPDEISGLFVIEAEAASIGVNANHAAVRQRFTVAHELGHFVFHGKHGLFIDFKDVQMTVFTSDDQQQQERKANWFAADLLMPRGWIERDFQKYGEENLTLFAQRYGVSEQALWFRLLNLRLVDSPVF